MELRRGVGPPPGAVRALITKERIMLIFGCSGGSDVGGLADQAARRLAKDGKGKMYCLAGVGAGIPNMLETARSAERIIAIDGCQVNCAKRIMENAGLRAEHYNLKDMGFEKGSTVINDETIRSVVEKINRPKM